LLFLADYLQPGDVADSSSSRDLVDRGRLDQILPPLDRRRPQSNVIQPIADPQQPTAALPGPGDAGKESGGRVDGSDEKTVASTDEEGDDDDDDDDGYSSGADDDDDEDDHQSNAN